MSDFKYPVIIVDKENTFSYTGNSVERLQAAKRLQSRIQHGKYVKVTVHVKVPRGFCTK